MSRQGGTLRLLVASLLVLVLTLPACSSPSAPAPSNTPAKPSPTTVLPGEPYKIGLMAAITGLLASTSAPFTQGFIAYITKLNDAGGLNGHKIELMVEDDRGEAAAGAASAKKMTDAGVALIYNTSLSATFPATIAEAKRVNIPAIFAVVAPDEALPPTADHPNTPDPLIFSLGSRYATPTTSVMPFIAKYLADKYKTGPVKLAVLGTELPVSKKNVDNIVAQAARFGIETKGQVVPIGTTDISAVADTFKAWGANWMHSAAPGPVGQQLYDKLKTIGLNINFVDQTFIMPFEPSMDKYKNDTGYYDCSLVLPFFANMPEHQEIKDALTKQGVTAFHSGIIHGWMDGKVVTTALTKSGWPLTTAKLLDVMQNLEVDQSPLMGPAKWTPTDHVGSAYWKVYHWENGQIVAVTPWVVTDVLGTDIKTVDTLPGVK